MKYAVEMGSGYIPDFIKIGHLRVYGETDRKVIP
jgi:hypothetical protein